MPVWFVALGLALVLCAGSAHAEVPGWGDSATWLSRAPRASAGALLAVGDDLRDVYRLQGRTLKIHALDTGRVRALKVPQAPWTSLHLAPPTDGEVERAALVARGKGQGRLLLLHLRTGRVIGDWSGPIQVPAGVGEASVAWAPDGRRLSVIGWPLEGPGVSGELALRHVEATLGTIVTRVDVPDLGVVDAAALLADGRTVALGTERRLALLGPGPLDARTFPLPPRSRLVGATRDALVLWRPPQLLLVDVSPGEGLRVRAELSAEGLTGQVWAHPRGRFAVALSTGGPLLLDGREHTLRTLPGGAELMAVLVDRLIISQRGRLGAVDLLR